MPTMIMEDTRKLLIANLKADALKAPWTPESSELVDIIDQGVFRG